LEGISAALPQILVSRPNPLLSNRVRVSLARTRRGAARHVARDAVAAWLAAAFFLSETTPAEAVARPPPPGPAAVVVLSPAVAKVESDALPLQRMQLKAAVVDLVPFVL
jgi:hypothetical protein